MLEEKVVWGGNTPWKNSTAFYNFLRGTLRRGWNRHPQKLIVLNKKRYRIPNPNPKGRVAEVWGFDCEMCKETFPIKDGQIDHITPAGSLRCREDIQGFVERLMLVTEEELRIVCKECNSALSLAERQGISYEEAVREKKAINLMKKNSGRDWLVEQGLEPASNAKLRREQIVEELKCKE